MKIWVTAELFLSSLCRCESRPTLSLMSVETSWAWSSTKEWYGKKTTFVLFKSPVILSCHLSFFICSMCIFLHWKAQSFPAGWVPSMPPACPLWTSSGSTCPCTYSAGPWCAVMCRRKGSSRPLAPTTSTWPCCWSFSSCPLCLPSTPSSPSPHPLTVDPSGNDACVNELQFGFFDFLSQRFSSSQWEKAYVWCDPWDAWVGLPCLVQ